MVCATFERYGKISKLIMKTKYNSMFQQAFITYDNISAIEYFKDDWIIFIEKDRVRIVSLTLTEDERNQRRNYVFKLSGFHAGHRKIFKGQICAILRTTVLRRSADMPLRSAEKNYKNLRKSL